MNKLLIVLILFCSHDAYCQTAEEFFYRAVDKYEKGEYQAAIDLYTSAINLEPKTDDNSLNLLQSLKKTYNHFDMGIYLTVLENGKINIGDKILEK